MATLNKMAAKKPVTSINKKPASKPEASTEKPKKTSAPAAEAKPAPKRGFPPKKDGAAANRAPRPPKATWNPPNDMKPAFYEILFTTDDHGLIDVSTISAARVKGKWENSENARYDLREFDVNTMIGIVRCLSIGVYFPNAAKRLPPNTEYYMVLRAGPSVRKDADPVLRATIASARYLKGKKWVWFTDKKDPTYRLLRRCAKILPSAFVDAQLPPIRKRKTKTSEDSEE